MLYTNHASLLLITIYYYNYYYSCMPLEQHIPDIRIGMMAATPAVTRVDKVLRCQNITLITKYNLFRSRLVQNYFTDVKQGFSLLRRKGKCRHGHVCTRDRSLTRALVLILYREHKTNDSVNIAGTRKRCSG